MALPPGSRRELLVWCSAMAASWALPSRAQAAVRPQHEHGAPSSHEPHEQLKYFSPEDAQDIEAIAEIIIPSDVMPGAREAGVLYFIDIALATFDRDKQSAYATGLTQARREVARLNPDARHVHELRPDQQEQFMEALAKTPFFEVIRTHAIMGFFGSYGGEGNRGAVGWKLIGFEDKFAFHPPFGFYDAERAVDL